MNIFFIIYKVSHRLSFPDFGDASPCSRVRLLAYFASCWGWPWCRREDSQKLLPSRNALYMSISEGNGRRGVVFWNPWISISKELRPGTIAAPGRSCSVSGLDVSGRFRQPPTGLAPFIYQGLRHFSWRLGQDNACTIYKLYNILILYNSENVSLCTDYRLQIE